MSKLTGGAYNPPGQSPHSNARGVPEKPRSASPPVVVPTSVPFVQDVDLTIHVGDALEVLRSLPDESVHCCVTSPPYWGLRDYGTGAWDGGDPACDHAPVSGIQGTSENSERAGRTFTGSKPQGQTCSRCGATRVDRQLGLEATPDEYVAAMVAVFREVRRVLRRDGTCWVNLGDSYAANVGGHKAKPGPGEQAVPSAWRGEPGQTPVKHPTKPKDLVGIPWRVAFALQADGWYLRSDIVWSKPNPMPESVTDRPTKAHEYVFLLSRSPRYFFDAQAVREPNTEASLRDYLSRGQIAKSSGNGETSCGHGGAARVGLVANGRNVRSVWEIAAQPYPQAHFATFPEALPERCILAGTSERGCCPVCWAPWEREVERGDLEATDSARIAEWDRGKTHGQHGASMAANLQRDGFKPNHVRPVTTTGWRPSCDHADFTPVPCVVLDPFLGSGTTALVARRHGRRCIGIELSPQYAALAADRTRQLSLLAGEPA